MADKYAYSRAVTTPMVTGSFVHLTADDIDDNDKFSITCVLPEGENYEGLKSAEMEAAEKCWGSKAAQMLKHPKYRSPFRDGGTQVDREGKLRAGFCAGQTTWKMSSKQEPTLVDRQLRKIVDTKGKTLVDADKGLYQIVPENEVFSGCVFFASGCAQAYDREDGFGVSFKLDNVQLVGPGKRLGGGGRMKPEQAFKPISAPVSDASFMD